MSVMHVLYVYNGCRYGAAGDSGWRMLESSMSHRDKFERGNCDDFILDAVPYLGELICTSLTSK